MFGTAVLDVVVGLAFIFSLFSLIVSVLQELLSTIFRMRAKDLASVIQGLLRPGMEVTSIAKMLREQWSAEATQSVVVKLKENVLKLFYENPLIAKLHRAGRLPSYIPVKTLSAALFDMICRAGSENAPKGIDQMEAFRRGVESTGVEIGNGSLSLAVSTVVSLSQSIEEKVSAARLAIEKWFNDTMERAQGWYKRKQQIIAIVLSLAVVVAFNLDGVRIVRVLWHDAPLRQSLSAQAVAYIQADDKTSSESKVQELREIGIPLGWTSQNVPVGRDWLLAILGWLFSVIAISQGSPFWFDLLNTFVNVRGTGKKPEDK